MGELEGRDVLRSWKEIAAFLGVTVRTAQLWERQRGLPVKRRPGRRSQVWTTRDELRAWEQGARSESAAPFRKQSKRGVSVILLAGLAALFAYARWREGPQPAVARLRDEHVEVLDGSGNILWKHQFPQVSPALDRDEPWKFLRVEDVDLDGRHEVLFSYLDEDRRGVGGALLLFGADGALHWRRPYGRTLVVDGAELSPGFYGEILDGVQVGDRRLLLTVSVHQGRYPSEVALLDPIDGSEVDTYYHPGYLTRHLVVDLDGDERAELLLGGTNNPGPGVGCAVVLAFRLPFSEGDGQREGYDYFRNPAPSPVFYVVFPTSDVARVIHDVPFAKELSLFDNSQIGVEIRGSTFGGLFYRLQFAQPAGLRLVGFDASDGFRQLHAELFHRGLLDHELGPDELAALADIRVLSFAPDCNIDPRSGDQNLR